LGRGDRFIERLDAVGASVKDITPTADMFPLTRRPAVTMMGQILDPLHVRVIALSSGASTVLMVSTETGRGPYGPQFAQAVADRAHVPIEAVFLSATHSHAAPEITSRIDLVFDPAASTTTTLQKWGKLVMDQMMAATDEALANMQPASVGIAYSKSYVNVNRGLLYNQVNADGTVSKVGNFGYNAEGASDKTEAGIRFNDASGKPIAFIVNYAVHGTVMHANTIDGGSTAISADIPGMISGYLEANNPGSVAMWLSGAAGDQNPIVQNDVYSADPATGEFREAFTGNYDLLSYLARANFVDTQKALSKITSYKSNVAVSYAFRTEYIPSIATGLKDYPVTLQMIRIGDIVFAGSSGELFTQLGIDMKKASPLKNTLVVNHVWQKSYQQVGYHPDDASIAAGTGNANTAKYKPGYLKQSLVKMMKAEINETSKYVNNGDGTVTRGSKTTIVGPDLVPGTKDDNQVLNPAGKVLLKNVKVKRDAQNLAYVDLGNGFRLYGGEDHKLGAIDDTVEGFGSTSRRPAETSSRLPGGCWTSRTGRRSSRPRRSSTW
jgi:hypothetical protein